MNVKRARRELLRGAMSWPEFVEVVHASPLKDRAQGRVLRSAWAKLNRSKP